MTTALWTPPADLVLPEDVDLERVVPRVCHYPDYAFSSGTEAIELAASAGLILDPWQQLAIQLGLGETPEGRWAAFQVALIVARQNGKGAILECLALFWLFGTNERLIGHSAHEYKTAMEAFRRVLSLIMNTDYLRKKVKKVINTNGEEGIELLNGNRLRFMARSKGAGRGFSFDKLIWDEAYALTGEQQDAQLPTLSAMPNPQIWLTSSPPLDAASGAALFRLRRAAEAKAAGIAFLDYGRPGSLDALEEIDLDDDRAALLANPAAPHRISLEAMARERAAMGDVGYARERLGIWPPDLSAGFTVISKEQWAAIMDPHSGKERYEELPATMDYWPEPSLPPSDPRWRTPPTALVRRPCLSLHISPRNQGRVVGSISIAQYRADGKRHVELIKTAAGSSWLVADMVKLIKSTNACAVAIDPGSPAGSVLPDLETAMTEAGIDLTILVKMSARDVAQAFGMIYDAATSTNEGDRSVVHLGQSELDMEVGAAGKRPVGDGHAWDQRNAAVPLTGLISVTHALFGLAVRGSEVQVMPWVMFG
jgi:hypothetical protein